MHRAYNTAAILTQKNVCEKCANPSEIHGFQANLNKLNRSHKPRCHTVIRAQQDIANTTCFEIVSKLSRAILMISPLSPIIRHTRCSVQRCGCVGDLQTPVLDGIYPSPSSFHRAYRPISFPASPRERTSARYPRQLRPPLSVSPFRVAGATHQTTRMAHTEVSAPSGE